MNVKVRKLVVGGAVLAVVVLAYLGYMRLGGNQTLDMDVDELMPHAAPHSPIAEEIEGNVGAVGGVGIRTVKQTRFFHTDADGNIDREFGFDELIHSESEHWVITNPYMRLFLGDIRCRVTADRGQVKVETDAAFGRPSPGDARFEGNVVIRIIPSDPNDPKSLFVYLDDVAFIADQSQFSTAGDVRFVSRTAQLVGRGMDLLYDEPARVLRLFRIRDLESLRLRSAEFGSLADVNQRDEDVAGSETPVETTAGDSATASVGATPAAAGASVYECIFYRNVTITTSEQKITARDRLAIDNILWSGSEPDDSGDKSPVEAEVAAETAEPNASESLPYPGPAALDTTPSESLALEAIPESFFDVVVTCDQGFVIAPKGSRHLSPDPNDWNLVSVRKVADANQLPTEPVADPNHEAVVVAQRIDFDVTTTDTTLLGPVAMTFALDANDLTGRDSDEGYIPMTITAQDAVRYIAAADRIQLEGNCAVTLQQTEPNYTYEYMLTAPMLALDLAKDPNAAADSTGLTLDRFTASGGPVAVHAQRKAGPDLVGWVELKAAKLDYEADRQEFVVSGPGKISLANGEDIDVGADPNEFSIGQPCFAFMRNFDVLTYSAATDLIVADAKDRQILLDYYPRVDGSYDERFVEADAGRIEIQLTRTGTDRIELASIAALEGIDFEDNDNQFAGSNLFYDHAQNLVTVTGDEAQPCYLNGALVDRIEMDTRTGEIGGTEIRSPTMLQINR